MDPHDWDGSDQTSLGSHVKPASSTSPQPRSHQSCEAGLEPYGVPGHFPQHGKEVYHEPSGNIIPVNGVLSPMRESQTPTSADKVPEDPIAPTSTLKEAEHTIRRLRRTVAILAVSLFVVIIAAAVGGGVGGTMAVKAAKSAAAAEALVTAVTTYPSIVTVTSSSSSPSGTPTVFVPPGPVRLALDCPRIDQTTTRVESYANSGEFTFSMQCGFDLRGFDTLSIRTYSMTDCLRLRACARHNEIAKPRGSAELKDMTACKAVVFSSNMPFHPYGNCWLKNGTTALNVPDDLDKRGPMVVGTITGYATSS